jgi:protein gp37
MPTAIEWCDESWNPIQDVRKGKSGRGYHCSKVSPACLHCWAETMNNRFGNGFPFDTTPTKFEIMPDVLEKLVHWRKPRRIAIQLMGDLFHGAVTFDQIDAVLAPTLNHPQHTYLILTKRVERMWDYFYGENITDLASPLWWSHLWLGTTAENQEYLEQRVECLCRIPAAGHFLSMEPLLEQVYFARDTWQVDTPFRPGHLTTVNHPHGIDWVICGAEQSHGARWMEESWARYVRDQCFDNGIPFFFKKDSRGRDTLFGVKYHEFPESL